MTKISGALTTPNSFDAQYDADTLGRAAEIKADKPRHKAALAHVAKKVKGMSKVLTDKDAVRVAPQHAKALAAGHLAKVRDPYPSVADNKTF